MIAKIALFTVFLVGANCFYINQEFNRPIALEDLEDLYSQQPLEFVQPVYVRERRQVHGVVIKNPDGTTNIMAGLPLAGNDKNILSAVSSIDIPDLKDPKTDGHLAAATAGLTLDNVKGHSLSLTEKHIPKLGDQVSAAAKVNFLNTNNHDLSTSAFASRTFSKDPVIPNFNTYGGGVDYMFNKKIGASVNVAHTPEFQKTDYSAMGKFNLFRDRSSSLDFTGGATKSVSPFIPKTSWQPAVGLSFSKFW